METVVGIVIGLVAAWALLVVVLWIARPRDVRLGELARVVPDIARLVRDLLADPASPASVRLALLLLLAWLVWPFDVIPEIIPILGRSTTSWWRCSCCGSCGAGWATRPCARGGAAPTTGTRC